MARPPVVLQAYRCANVRLKLCSDKVQDIYMAAQSWGRHISIERRIPERIPVGWRAFSLCRCGELCRCLPLLRIGARFRPVRDRQERSAGSTCCSAGVGHPGPAGSALLLGEIGPSGDREPVRHVLIRLDLRSTRSTAERAVYYWKGALPEWQSASVVRECGCSRH